MDLYWGSLFLAARYFVKPKVWKLFIYLVTFILNPMVEDTSSHWTPVLGSI